MSRTGFIAGLLAGLLSLFASPIMADPIEEFYRGKTVTMLVGTASGNDYDYRARLVARHLGRFIPGQPVILVRNMPGGGGIVAANHLAKVAPKDGTVLLAAMQNIPTLQALGSAGVDFDARAFPWVGNTIDGANAIATWHTSGVSNIEETKSRELIIGAVMGNASIYYMAAMNALVGTKFKVVTGYAGGNELNLAMERGEIAGRSNAFAGWYATQGAWIKDKKIKFLVQIGLKRDPRYPDVPLLLELARNDFDRKVLSFISADTAISRPIATAPGVPADRVEALRHAFDIMVKDPQFLADAEKEGMEIDALNGGQTQKVVDDIVNAAPDVIGRAKDIINAPTRQ